MRQSLGAAVLTPVILPVRRGREVVGAMGGLEASF
jgi:hypothetical protein